MEPLFPGLREKDNEKCRFITPSRNKLVLSQQTNVPSEKSSAVQLCLRNGGGKIQDIQPSNIENKEKYHASLKLGWKISPDDVVGVIGQKQFWKARQAIINQQRVFGLQVFELHRLTKVQKLMAGSPHLRFANPRAFKSSTAIIETQAAAIERKEINPMPLQTAESLNCNSADNVCDQLDNVTTNTETSSQSTDILSTSIHETDCESTDESLVSLSPLPNRIPENEIGPDLCLPPDNQWLVPVLSPLQGIVYRPYLAPFPLPGVMMAPMIGSSGPVCLPAMAGGFIGDPTSGLGLFPQMPPSFMSFQS